MQSLHATCPAITHHTHPQTGRCCAQGAPTLPRRRSWAATAVKRSCVALRSTEASMATAASILAIVRAAAPTFRSRQEQLAFAVHAAVAASGYRLVGVGNAATLEGLSADAPDASTEGWASGGSAYAFAYLSEATPAAAAAGAGAAAQPPVLKLLLRIVPVGDALLTVLATDAASAEPQTLELQVDEFTTAPAAADGAGGGGAPAPAPLTAAAAAKSFTHLDRLCSSISMALAQLTAASAAGAGGSSSSSTKQASGGSAAAPAARQQGRDEGGTRRPQPQPQPQQPDRDDPLRIGPPRRPMRVGEDDIMPHLGGGGGGPMGIGGIGGGPLPMMPPGGGGGTHVGPGHPFFADRMRHPDVMPGRGGPGGGIRWDPISPEGLQGWQPEDFQRPGPAGFRPGQGPGQPGFRGPAHPDLDPDLAQPGPRGAPDWDSMYG